MQRTQFFNPPEGELQNLRDQEEEVGQGAKKEEALCALSLTVR